MTKRFPDATADDMKKTDREGATNANPALDITRTQEVQAMPVEANIAIPYSLTIETNQDRTILVDHKARTLSFGQWSSSRFHYRAKESYFDLKNIVLQANDIPLPEMFCQVDDFFSEYKDVSRKDHGRQVANAHKHYKEHLGPKFNARLFSASWGLHVGWMPKPLWKFIQRDGYHWRIPREEAVYSAYSARDHILTAHKDGLDNIVPILIAFEKSPSEIRASVGRAAWRKIAGNSPTRNHKIAQALFDVGVSKRAEILDAVLSIKSGNLHNLGLSYLPVSHAVHANRISTVEGFSEAIQLITDAARMGSYNPKWGMARLRREHDLEAERQAAGQYSNQPFCAPHVCTVDGFTFTRLISPMDVAKEAAAQRHCGASYIGDCTSGSYALYRVEGRERATLGLHMRNGAPVALDQLYGARNARVSDQCRSAALDFIHDDEFSREWAA